MSVIKLTNEHQNNIIKLFSNNTYMGKKLNEDSFKLQDTTFNKLTYDMFCATYLSDLNNFHAYGYINEYNEVAALISFYQSFDEPSWYYTMYRSSGNNNLLRPVLDAVIDHNEKNGRLKFYTLTTERHSKLLRRFHWSEYNNERYGYFDEYYVPEKAKCFYTSAWELLYKRFLVPSKTVVRCNYLKQEYRTTLPMGGNI